MTVLCKKNYCIDDQKIFKTGEYYQDQIIFKEGEYYEAKLHRLSSSLTTVYKDDHTIKTFSNVDHSFTDNHTYLYQYFYTPEEMRKLKIKSLLDDNDVDK